MEWWTKLKRVMGVPEDEFMPEDEMTGENKREQYFDEKFGSETNENSYSHREPKYETRRETRTEPRREPRKARDEKFMNINATAQLQVVLVKPEDFREAAQIADHLINKKTVLLNLEGADRELVRRMVDFLSGAAYAQGGTLKRVANGTFIVTPYDVNIMGDVLDELRMDRVAF